MTVAGKTAAAVLVIGILMLLTVRGGGEASAGSVVVKGTLKDQLGRPVTNVKCTGTWSVFVKDAMGMTSDVLVATTFPDGTYRVETRNNVRDLVVEFYKKDYEMAGARIEIGNVPKNAAGNVEVTRDFTLWGMEFGQLPKLEEDREKIGCFNRGLMKSMTITTGTGVKTVLSVTCEESWRFRRFPLADSVTTPGTLFLDLVSVPSDPIIGGDIYSTHTLFPANTRMVLRLVGSAAEDGLQGAGVAQFDKMGDDEDALSARNQAPEHGYESTLEIPTLLFKTRSMFLFYVRYKGMYGKGLVLSPEYRDHTDFSCDLTLSVSSNGSRELRTRPASYTW